MTISDIVDQLRAKGYDLAQLEGRQIVITSSIRHKASGMVNKDFFMHSDIIIIDGKIYKDRTGLLEGERGTIKDLTVVRGMD